MVPFLTRCFLFSACLLTGACASHYKTLQSVEVDRACLDVLQSPVIETSWFDASVDVAGRHISGLLLIKNMADSSRRVVFTNEAGVTFFDFEYRSDGSFTPKKILSKLDNRAVINTLRKDFALLLGLYFNDDLQSWSHDGSIYVGTRKGKEIFYYVTGGRCSGIARLEIGSKRKRKVSIEFQGGYPQTPAAILIRHHTFDMDIQLRKLDTVHGRLL